MRPLLVATTSIRSNLAKAKFSLVPVLLLSHSRLTSLRSAQVWMCQIINTVADAASGPADMYQ